MSDPLIKHLSCAMSCDKFHGYSSPDGTKGQAIHSVLPRQQTGGNSSGVREVEQGHFVHSLCVEVKLLFSACGPGEMA